MCKTLLDIDLEINGFPVCRVLGEIQLAPIDATLKGCITRALHQEMPPEVSGFILAARKHVTTHCLRELTW